MVIKTDRFIFSVDKAGRHWIWDSALGQNIAMKAKTRDGAIMEALTLLSNSYSRVLSERNTALDIVDKIRDVVCQEDE